MTDTIEQGGHSGDAGYGAPTGIYGPVADWATDLDHADPEYNQRAHEIWVDLVQSGCPVAHSDRYGGMWAPFTAELVREVAYDTEHFTSRSVVVSTSTIEAEAPIGGAPPITSDPPFHQLARRLLLPPFAPKQIEPWEPEVQRLCRQRLDEMGEVTPGETVVDAARQYAQHIPVSVIARMLGLPEDDDEKFREIVHHSLEGVNLPPEERKRTFEQLDAYLDLHIERHRAEPQDDLISYLLDVELGGQKLSHEHVRGSIALLLIAGIDTTWSAIGSSIWHLATHAADRHRLTAEPELMPTAIEELLRAYAPVTMARMVATDHDFHGCPMKADEWVLLPFPAANRDPELFDRADEVILDRLENRHAAFGLGIHRCLGSNLARLEVKVAVEEFIARFPDFELAGPVRWSVGQIRGPRELPVRIL
ncbi:MAG: cytochrome P450 [Ilumatobacteraceae bacterium]